MQIQVRLNEKNPSLKYSHQFACSEYILKLFNIKNTHQYVIEHFITKDCICLLYDMCGSLVAVKARRKQAVQVEKPLQSNNCKFVPTDFSLFILL